MKTYCLLLRLSYRRSCGVARGSWLLKSVERVRFATLCKSLIRSRFVACRVSWKSVIGYIGKIYSCPSLETSRDKGGRHLLAWFLQSSIESYSLCTYVTIIGSYGAAIETNRWWILCRWICCDVFYVFVHICNGLVTLFWSRLGDVARRSGELCNQIVSLMCLNDFSFSCGW